MNKNFTNKLGYFLSFAGITLSILLFASLKASAQVRSYSYDNIKVDVVVNKDSTVDVTEEFAYRFNGIYHAVKREISLSDETQRAKCKADPALQCGGLEFIEIQEVTDNLGNILTRLPDGDYRYDSSGNLLSPPDTYSLETLNVGGDERVRIQWVFSEPGKDFANEVVKFKVKYRVYGSIGYFPEENYDLFYWNAVFQDRESIAKNVEINVSFPQDIKLTKDDFSVLSDLGYSYLWKYLPTTNTLNITSENLPPYQGVTVLAKIPRGVVDQYGSLDLKLFPGTQNVSFGSVEDKEVKNNLNGLPPGKYEFTFSADGWKSKTISVNILPGEAQALTVNLQPTTFTIGVIIAFTLCNILGCVLLPLAILIYVRHYIIRGRDKDFRKTIIPQYSPPEAVRPYLLGSIKDEQVDMVDITSTLIDLAYRGYIKIREFEAKSILGIKIGSVNYEFIKLKEFDDLNESEQKIIISIFGTKDRVSTESLKESFYLKIPPIKDKIYDELVSLKYFAKRPDKIRSKYSTIGCMVFILGFVLIFLNFLFPLFITLALSILVFGIVIIATSKFMPAKTALGSKIFAEILGFKMYMDTAERFRVQNLTPETFEKYLSYAIVFGIEKKWAEKFKDICKTPPSWYEGSNMSSWNTLYLANALTSFRTSTSQVMASTPAPKGNSFGGGGWSGGGGFGGGFSGGGGGGGGGGAW